jgi:UbiD family decarboxylase
MRHLRSLREYIVALDEIGDLQRIDVEVDWNLEIGAVIRRCYDLCAPAPLFCMITGHAGSRFQVLGAPGGLSSLPGAPLARIALALGPSA